MRLMRLFCRTIKEVKLLENVDELEVEGDEIRLINIFGEQKILKAQGQRVQRVRQEDPSGASPVTLLSAL